MTIANNLSSVERMYIIINSLILAKFSQKTTMNIDKLIDLKLPKETNMFFFVSSKNFIYLNY